MKQGIRKHLRDFVAIVALFVIAGAVSAYILDQQRLTLPAWVPVIGKDFFEFQAEFETGQAVTPGQGQTVNVAGVEVGHIARVELDDGRAVLTLRLENRFARVHRDARMLLRPKTGLKDMSVELDPGTAAAGRLAEGARIPVGQTTPDVNLDEVLAVLDGDTRAYLQVLVNDLGEGLEGRRGDLAQTARRFEPLAHHLRQVSDRLAERRRHIRRAVHNLSLLAGELGARDDQLARLVEGSNGVLGALARQEDSLRAALDELPSTLAQTRTALAGAQRLGGELGPALQALRPAARRLAPALRDVRPFLRDTAPVLRDRIRPLVRAVVPFARRLRPAARDLSAATPDLTASLRIVNRALDMLAFNPPGEEEGFLFWFAWANHIAGNIFTTQDAHGPIRRGLLIGNCNVLDGLDDVAAVHPLLGQVVALLNAPRTSLACPDAPAGERRAARANGGGR